MARWILATWIACTGLLGLASSASAGEFTIPQAWEGVWNISEVERDCGTSGGIPVNDVDILCAGDPVFEGPIGCTGFINDTNVDITCESTMEVFGFPDCFQTFSTTLVATRTGDTYVATWEDAILFTGCPPIFEDICEEAVTNGTRTSEDPECLVPVIPTSWTEIKAVF